MIDRVQHQISFWDSLIMAAALTPGVNILYTEDMQNGLIAENQLAITNPFGDLAAND